jgi:hypothetical protein
MCGTHVVAGHGHVVDIQSRSLMCACRACYLLFTRPASAGGKYRAVPDRYLHDADHPITAAEWESLGIPVGSAFFLRSGAATSTEAATAAFYPSPAGATECLLDLTAWTRLCGDHPLLAAAEPEVEAILIRGTDHGVECFLVPIDACYHLVGTVRRYWKGFDGGAEARQHVDGYFDAIRSQARQYQPEE